MLQKKIKTITLTFEELFFLHELVDTDNIFVTGLSIVKLKTKLRKALDEAKKKDAQEAF